MKKYLIGILVLVFSISLVIAGGERLPAKVFPTGTEIEVPQQAIDAAPVILDRIIVPTTSVIDKIGFTLKGCKILHHLNDATALQCPDGVEIEGARPDRLNKIHDLAADVQINADDVWALGFDGSGIKVAILDTGVDETHIELSDSIVATNNFVKGPDFDNNGHGTHVSGIVTGNGINELSGRYAKGVAPGADIIVGKVCGNFGCFDSDIMAGIEWAVAQGADILTISIGGGNFGSHCDNDQLAAKVNWAVLQGLVVTISSGNDGAGVSSPACASGAIAIGATYYKNYGENQDWGDCIDITPQADDLVCWSNYGSALDLVAPGVDIFSTYSCKAAGNCNYYWYATMSGTSMSAPAVAGTAALILDKNPGYTVDNVKEALYNTAVDLGAAGYDIYYGHGRVDALAAVTYSPTPACTTDADCSDGLFCNGAETCQAGVCQAGTSVDCSGLNDQCNAGVCDETTDSCVKQSANEGLSCNDGLFCNVGETCQSGVCIGGSAYSCNDNNTCTTDSCNEATDSCVNTPVADGTLCNDDLFCTVTDVCTAGLCGGAARDCSDAVSCTVDSCNEITDSCANNPYNSLCSDGLFCNGAEVCDAVLGCQAGTPVDCNDGNVCTTDSCNEVIKACENTPIPGCSTAVCGDNYCAGEALGETCNTCPADCPSKTNKKISWCCGDGTCSGKGENADSCPVDCA